MKKHYLVLIALFTTVLFAFSQNTSKDGKMTFQGSLFQNGEPVNGNVELTFTIPLTSGEWTETLSGVSVANGLYSVVLGNTNPIPNDLFMDASSRQVTVAVDGTGLGEVSIYPSFTPGIIQVDSVFSNVIYIDNQETNNYTEVNDFAYRIRNRNEAASSIYLTNNNSSRLQLADFDETGATRSLAFLTARSNGNIGLSMDRFETDGSRNLLAEMYSSDLFIDGTVLRDGYARGGVDFYNNRGIQTSWFTSMPGDEGGGDPDGWSAGMGMYGTNSINFVMEGKKWENNDLGAFSMFGEHTNGDGWFNRNIAMNVNSDGTKNSGQMEFFNTLEGADGEERVINIDSDTRRITLFDPSGEEAVNFDGNDGSAFFQGGVQFNGDVVINGTLTGPGVGDGTVTLPDVLSGSDNVDVAAGEEIYGVRGEASGTGADNFTSKYTGVLGVGSAAVGDNAGVRGEVTVPAGNTNGGFSKGVQGTIHSDEPNATGYAVRGDLTGQFGFSSAVRGIAGNTQGNGNVFNSNNIGGFFSASQNPEINVGVVGDARGDGAAGSRNIGVSGESTRTNSIENIGVFGTASGASGDNWAGFFDGATKVTGDLSVDGPITTNEINLGVADFNAIAGDGSANTNNGGNINLRGYSETSGIRMYGEFLGGDLIPVSHLAMDDNSGSYVWLWGSGDIEASGSISATRASFSNPNDGQEVTNIISQNNGTQLNLKGFVDGLDNGGGVSMGTRWFAGGPQRGYVHVRGTVNPANYFDANMKFQMQAIDRGDGVEVAEFTMHGNELDGNSAALSVLEMSSISNGDDSQWGSEISMKRTEPGAETQTINLNGLDGSGYFAGDLTVDGNLNANITVSPDFSGQTVSANNIKVGDFDIATTTGMGVVLDNFGSVNLSGNLNLNVNSSGVIYNPVSLQSGQSGGEIFVNDDTGASWAHFQSEFRQLVISDGGGTNGSFITSTGMFGGDGSGSYNIGIDGNSSFSNDMTVGGYDGTNGTGVLIEGTTGDLKVSRDIYAGGALVNTSDKRLKENIKPLEQSLTHVSQLRGVTYNWKDKEKTQKNQIGVIAQEVEKIYPEFVFTDKNGMKSVNYAQMTAVLIEAIKELNAEVKTLKSENAELKAEATKTAELSKRIETIEKLLQLQAGSSTSSAKH